MIQKCPNCGQWCESEGKKSMIGRFAKGWTSTVDRSYEVGESIGGVGGGFLSGVVLGGNLGVVAGAAEALFGNKYQFECPNCGFKWGTDREEDDQTQIYEDELNQPIIEAIELSRKTSSLKNSTERDISNHVKELQSLLSNDVIAQNNDYRSLLYDALAYSQQVLLNDALSASDSIKRSLQLFPDDPTTKSIAGMIRGIGNNPQADYDTMKLLISYKSIDEENSIPHFTQAQFSERFETLSNLYIDNFLDIQPIKRRFLVIDEYLRFLPDSFVVLPIDRIPRDINFPSGHPRVQELYVVHPYKPNYYIPFDDFQYSMFRDELEEFCWIMECLGAKTINSHEMQNDEKSINTLKDATTSGGVDYSGKFSANASYERGQDSEEYRKLTMELIKDRFFEITPNIRPYIPEDVVWYPHRPEWHRNCESRRMGRLAKASYMLSTSSITTTSKQEKKKIEADLNILLAKANGTHEQEEKFSLKTNENHTWSVDVEFYPLNEYVSKGEIKPQPLNTPLLQGSQTNNSIPNKRNNLLIIGLLTVIVLLIILIISLFIK